MHKCQGSIVGAVLVALILNQAILQISSVSGSQSNLDPNSQDVSSKQDDDQASCGCKRKPSDMSVRTLLSSSEPLIAGPIHDCCCTAETVESVNEKILPILDQIAVTPFFRYYKLNLWRECVFFPDDGQCASRSCAVDECEEEEFKNVCSGHESGNIDVSLDGFNFQKWLEDGDPWTNDADVMNLGEHMNYVDLMKNPERFTGYSGPSATRIWKAIYDENCFVNEEGPLAADVVSTQGFIPHNEQCIEKRVFYRLISGLHSSITTHLTYEFSHDLSSQFFAPNVIRFYETVAKYPTRIHNMYLTYLMLLRAVSKALPTFYTFDYKTDQAPQIQALLHQLSQVTTTCPNTFDENVMFQGNDALTLKSQFKNHFRNISVILDCVACERCKLWGKLQINGLGTALKILFDAKQHPEDEPLQLERTELVALIHTLRRLSESLKWSNTMFKEYTTLHATKHNPRTLDGTPIFGGEKGMDPQDSNAPLDPQSPHPTHADPHLIPLEASQVNEDSHPHPQTSDSHINPEIYAIPPPIHVIHEDKWVDEPSWQNPETTSQETVKNAPEIEISESSQAESSQTNGQNMEELRSERTIETTRRVEVSPTDEHTVHQIYLPPNEHGIPAHAVSPPSNDQNSHQKSENPEERTENGHIQHVDPIHSETASSALEDVSGLPSQHLTENKLESEPSSSTQKPLDIPPEAISQIHENVHQEALPVHDHINHLQEQDVQPPFEGTIIEDSSIEAQEGSTHEWDQNDDYSGYTTASMAEEYHHENHDHGDYHHHDTDHHQTQHEAHSDHHGHSHDHGHVHSHGHHGMVGMEFGGDSFGVGGGHHHGGHEIPSESRDLSSISSDSWNPPNLEGFDLILAYAVEYWRVAKVTALDFYFSVVAPTLRENSSWYSGLAILSPVFLLFILALRRQPDAFVPFEEPMYRSAPGKATKGPKTSDPSYAVSRRSNGSSSDQSFAPSPDFVNSGPNHPTSEPLTALGTKNGPSSKRTSSTTRKPSPAAPLNTALANTKPAPLVPMASPSVPTSSRTSGRSSQSAGPVAPSPLVPLPGAISHTSNTSELKPRRSGSREAISKTSASDSPNTGVALASSSTLNAMPQNTVSTSPFPMPTPSMRSTANAPKVVAPRPRRTVHVPEPLKKSD